MAHDAFQTALYDERSPGTVGCRLAAKARPRANFDIDPAPARGDFVGGIRGTRELKISGSRRLCLRLSLFPRALKT
jgi:hypothetical protein